MTGVLLHGLAAGCRYALLAYGFGLVYQTTGIFHFAHGAVYAIAGYTAWLLLQHAAPASLALGGALLVAVAAGWLVEALLYRPLRARRASLDVLFLTSLGAYSAVANALAIGFGHETQTLGLGDRSFVLGTSGGAPLTLSAAEVAAMVAALVLFIGLWLLLSRTRFGLTVRAYAANPALAEALGLRSRRLLAQVAVVAALLAAVAAICVGADTGISPNMGLDAVVLGAVAVVIGGTGSAAGTAAAGLLLGLLRGAAAYTLGSRWEDAVVFGGLLLVLLIRPKGLFARR